jgi:hypothetical protein
MASFEVELADAIHKASLELAQTTLHEIQKSTAITWSARAIVSYQSYASSGSLTELMDVAEYAHEALEHAALAGPDFYLQVARVLRDLKY